MRTKGPSVAERASWLFRNYANRRIPVINGGSGSDQHPTQALLDIYTLIRSFKGIRGLDDKTLLLCGDLKRGRTVRSLSLLMKNFKNVKLLFVAPQKFQIEDDILELLDRFKVKYNIFTDGLKGHLSQADAIYMTRIQDEHDRYTGESKETNFDDFKLTYDDLPLLKSTACIMHPFPRRDEIDVLIDSDPRSKYWRQERNGMWTRSALIAYIFNVDTEILKY
jgi:aspartate carbamoyltransferase catalytic subunit